MTPKELERAGKKLYGQIHWRRDLANQLGKHVSTVGRWMSGRVEVPQAVELAIKGMMK